MTDREEWWGILTYEVQMYWATIRIREELGKAEQWAIFCALNGEQKLFNSVPFNQLIMNALIESKLLHIRILCEFILERTKRTDDVVLKDLLPNWQGDEELSAAVDELDSTYGTSDDLGAVVWKINKLIAHATKNRKTSHDYSAVFKAIDPPLKKCLKHIAKLSNREDLVQIAADL